MTTYLGKSCSFGLPRVPFVNCGQFMYLVISPFGFEGRMWDLIVSVPDHCLSFYFSCQAQTRFCHRTASYQGQRGITKNIHRTASYQVQRGITKKYIVKSYGCCVLHIVL